MSEAKKSVVKKCKVRGICYLCNTNTTIITAMRRFLIILIFTFTMVCNETFGQTTNGTSVTFNGSALEQKFNSYQNQVEAEQDTLNNLLDYIYKSLPECYDIKLKIRMDEISVNDSCYNLPIIITFVPNDKANELNTFIKKTLKDISVPDSELDSLENRQIHVQYIPCHFYHYKEGEGYYDICEKEETDSLNFRNTANSINTFHYLIRKYSTAQVFNFIIKDNLGNESYIEVSDTKEEEGPHNDDEVGIWEKGGYIETLIPHGLICLNNINDMENTDYSLYGDQTIHTEYNLQSTLGDWCYTHEDGGMAFSFPMTKELNLLLQIPKDDISKYKNFEISERSKQLKDINPSLP